MALLRYKNIQDGYLVFERAKTERTSRTDPQIITAYITQEITAIIERWGNKDKTPNNYIFPHTGTGHHTITTVRPDSVFHPVYQ
ncbi:MAG: hypothetical protein ICV84_13735 [Flavisolibacter sp.]|nr:hypothetical protein [Flavisolibacter sp.]